MYRPAQYLVQADALSRAATQEEESKEVHMIGKMDEPILKLHKANNHRKALDLYTKSGHNINNKELRTILDKCLVCTKRDNNRRYKG